MTDDERRALADHFAAGRVAYLHVTSLEGWTAWLVVTDGQDVVLDIALTGGLIGDSDHALEAAQGLADDCAISYTLDMPNCIAIRRAGLNSLHASANNRELSWSTRATLYRTVIKDAGETSATTDIGDLAQGQYDAERCQP